MKKGLSSIVILFVILTQVICVQAAARVYMGSWDLNGKGKLQKVYNCGTYIEVEQSNGTYKSYSTNSNNWALLKGGVADTDGKAGNEIAINCGTYIVIIHDATGSIKRYNINSGNWALLAGGITDTDGKAGNEIAINCGTTIEIIHDATGSIKSYNTKTPSWSLLGIYNQDGNPGNEIVYYYINTKYAICDAQNKQYIIR